MAFGAGSAGARAKADDDGKQLGAMLEGLLDPDSVSGEGPFINKHALTGEG